MRPRTRAQGKWKMLMMTSATHKLCVAGNNPEMSRIANVYLSCPTSSIYSDRLFLKARNIYETERNRMPLDGNLTSQFTFN